MIPLIGYIITAYICFRCILVLIEPETDDELQAIIMRLCAMACMVFALVAAIQINNLAAKAREQTGRSVNQMPDFGPLN